MAFDMKGCLLTENEKDGITEIGISTLDARHLSDGGEAISLSSRSISFSRKKDSKARVKFNFGELETLVPADVRSCLTSAFHVGDDRPSTNKTTSQESKVYRQIVLVGHCLKSDLRGIVFHGVNVQEILPIAALLDIRLFEVAQLEEALSMKTKLCDLLNRLGCPYGALHNAGNDATFTLKALLAFAIKTKSAGSEGKLRQLHQLAYEPIKEPASERFWRLKKEKRLLKGVQGNSHRPKNRGSDEEVSVVDRNLEGGIPWEDE